MPNFIFDPVLSPIVRVSQAQLEKLTTSQEYVDVFVRWLTERIYVFYSQGNLQLESEGSSEVNFELVLKNIDDSWYSRRGVILQKVIPTLLIMLDKKTSEKYKKVFPDISKLDVPLNEWDGLIDIFFANQSETARRERFEAGLLVALVDEY